MELELLQPGAYAVAATHIKVSDRWASLDDESMHEILLGRPDNDDGDPAYIADLLEHPDHSWLLEVAVPDAPEMYGPVSGQNLSVLSYVVYPSGHKARPVPYRFPYQDSMHGTFEHMLAPGEQPEIADAEQPFPLVVLAHGYAAHGIYDIDHAQTLAAHGYIVAVVNYGDLRTVVNGEPNHHLAYLRPLMTKAVIESLLESETFGPVIDRGNIGIGGHSYGGYTGLAIAGGRYLGEERTASHPNIKALSLAAPWTGGDWGDGPFYPFGEGHVELQRVTAPAITFFGTKDEATTAEYILPATQATSGPMYVVELVDEPHVFSGGAWQDRNQWETLFFNAYLKDDAEALALLAKGTSMQGGGNDRQRFDYQRLP